MHAKGFPPSALMNWAIPEKIQTGGVEDMEFPGVFVFALGISPRDLTQFCGISRG